MTARMRLAGIGQAARSTTHEGMVSVKAMCLTDPGHGLNTAAAGSRVGQENRSQ